MQYNESIASKAITELELEVLKFWQENQIFKKSVEQRPIDNQFVLYDGPPFATGLPHYGHILAHSIKDVFPRFQTMKGKRVERRFGWDCHGVPVEYEVEKNMKLQGTEHIERMGIGKFNEACRSIVQKYTKEWRQVEDRLGRFVDMDNDYKTMDLSFMESVWAVFKAIKDKGLVYEGKKVVSYSTQLGTALSDFESKLNYKKIQDPQITMMFPLQDEPNTSLLVWTTTPWSVPSNVAIAVNKNIEYVKVTLHGAEDKHYILAKACVESNFKAADIKKIEPVDTTSLIGARYQPIFHTIQTSQAKNCFQIIESDHVTEVDGTGLVHIAPAFGEDDYKLGNKHGLPCLDMFDKNGRFDREIGELSQTLTEHSIKGKNFKDADKVLIDHMKKLGRILRHDTIHHEYPFCWRTDTPLMYRAQPSWYIKVTAIKDRIIANNKTINWYPNFVGEKRFHDWLSNAHDWSISRSRYWGCPIPIWRNESDPDDCIFVGSVEELKALTGASPTDLHRHFIDDLVINKDGNTYRRIPEVFDCWFESGAMPYAQEHYPFENKELFEQKFPANFIAEGLDQTRGWFYTLMVLSTALFDKPAFQNCVVNGILLGEDGKKMSKSKGNYPKIDLVFEKYGADALRLVLLGSVATKAEAMKVSEEEFKKATRLVLIPMTHIYKFFAVMANQQGFQANTEKLQAITNPLDQWLIYHAEQFKKVMHEHYENYNLIAACNEIREFVDRFSRFYLRNSKKRLKDADPSEREQSLQAMHYALETMAKCIAPITPFMADTIYRDLYGHDNSVHLEFWPAPVEVAQYKPAYDDLEMVNKLIHLGVVTREGQRIELTQPLPELYLESKWREYFLPYEGLIKDVLNVEKITWVTNTDLANILQQKVVLDDKVLGPKYRSKWKKIKESYLRGEYELKGEELVIADVTLAKNEFSITYVPISGVAAVAERDFIVALNTALTPELIEKGDLRKLIHEIQLLRKEAKLTPKDSIVIQINGDDKLLKLVSKYEAEITKQTSCQINYQKTDGVMLSRPLTQQAYQGEIVLEKVYKDAVNDGALVILGNKSSAKQIGYRSAFFSTPTEKSVDSDCEAKELESCQTRNSY